MCDIIAEVVAHLQDRWEVGARGPPGASGPRGEQGPPGKLPLVKLCAPETVHYAGDVVAYDGGTCRCSQRRKLRRAQGCARSLPGFWLATVGEPRQARGRWREGRARRARTEGRSRIERRDDPRLEDRSRGLYCNARDVGRPRGPAARIARAIRAVLG